MKMKYSKNYGFALPTAKDDDLADIGVISRNFETVDEVMKNNEDLGIELNRFEADTMDVVGRLNAKDADLQSQIDNLGGVDLSELQSQIDTANTDIVEIQESVHTLDMELGLTKSNLDKVEARMGSWDGSGTLYDMVKVSKTDIATLKTTDENLQSQLDDKVDKVEGKGLSTNDYDNSAKEKVSKIGRTNLIPSDSRNIVQWIQDVYDSVFKSSADNICLADIVNAEISHRQSGDENLQSQIDALGGVDVSELETDIETLKTDVSNLQSADATVMDRLGRLMTADENLQSQLNTKVTRKVAVVGSDTGNSAGWYKVASGTMAKYQVISLLFAVHTPATSGKHSGILQLDLRGGTESIDTGDALKLGWLVRAGFNSSQVIVTVDGYNWALYFNVQSPRFFRTFFEVIQESSGNIDKATYNLHTDSVVETTAPVATAVSTDLGTVDTANKLTTARNINGIAFDGSADINITANDIASTSGQTLYQTIVDLTARIEALEKNSGGGSGGVSQAVLIDWDVNTNGATQGTVTKDANGLHASGDKSLRIANYWNCDVSAYDGITFTAYGSGKLRVEVGGVEGEYKTLGTTPTTYTIAFADIGLTELSGIEINLQTQGAYDLTVSDIFGYTNI